MRLTAASDRLGVEETNRVQSEERYVPHIVEAFVRHANDYPLRRLMGTPKSRPSVADNRVLNLRAERDLNPRPSG